MYIHVAPMCYTLEDDEPKSRPIQRSLSELMAMGIDIDMLIIRTKAGKPLAPEQRRKISESSIIPADAILESQSLKTVYALPLELMRQHADSIIARDLGIIVPGVGKEWQSRVNNIINPKKSIRIALCGKYTEVHDSYKSIKEALVHAGAKNAVDIDLVIFSTEQDFEKDLDSFDGIIVPGGYGSRGIEGKIRAIKHAREHNIPYLGLCYGMQLAVVEFARNICGLDGAHTTEVNPETKHPLIMILPEQEQVKIRSGTQRLGLQDAVLEKGSIVAKLYNDTTASERHRHRYEVNPEYHKLLTEKGLRISGVHAKNSHIAEFIELPDHPFFIATQSHPELKSTLLNPAPLFQGFVDAAMKRKEGK
jgi:CTP synthase